jgi:uncharacterized protein YbjT (DUF2867 family)
VRVAIAGGHGQIALRLTRLLHARGDEVLSLIRNPAHADDIDAAGGRAVVCDLEAAGVDEVAAAIAGADAVVFAAGAGPGSGSARKLTMDHGGAALLREACGPAGVRRYVMVSAIRADPDVPGDDTFSIYLRAKGRADAELMASDLAWTVVRPGRLTDEPGTGRVQVAGRLEHAEIPRDDVAAVLAAVLARPQTAGRAFDVVAGDEPVERAVDALAG